MASPLQAKAPQASVVSTTVAALDHYSDLLQSPTSADRSALGDEWADREVEACKSIRDSIQQRSLVVPAQNLQSTEGLELWGIVGRSWGDDDDTLQIVWGSGEGEASAQFRLETAEVSNLDSIPEDGPGSVIVTGAERIGRVHEGQFILERGQSHECMRERAEPPAVQAAVQAIDSNAEALLSLLDHAGSMESPAVLRAVAMLRQSIALATGDLERAQVAQEELAALAAEDGRRAMTPRG